MNSRSVLILVIGILIAILLVMAGFVIPIFLTGGAGSGRPRSRPRTRVFADSPAGHLIVGFSYLYPRIDFARSRGSVQRRMRRAIQRVDAVDPYSGARRIGSALLQAGLIDTDLADRRGGGGLVVSRDRILVDDEGGRTRIDLGAERGGTPAVTDDR